MRRLLCLLQSVKQLTRPCRHTQRDVYVIVTLYTNTHRVWTCSVLAVCICIVCLYDADTLKTRGDKNVCIRVRDCVQSGDVKAGIRLAYIARSDTFAIP